MLSIGDYLNMFWPDVKQALDIYESLKASLAEAGPQSKGLYWVLKSCNFTPLSNQLPSLTSFDLMSNTPSI